jgi:hypothetical protein
MKNAKGILRIFDGLFAVTGAVIAYLGYARMISMETLIWVVPILVMVITSLRLLMGEMAMQGGARERKSRL